tara:strand:+ start:43 stop:549 length:507 start_codon:yes stop_codon:yes gene_type:complete
MALPVIALPAFLTLVRQVGLAVAKRQVKKRLTTGFLTKNADKINKANKTFIKNKNKKPVTKKKTTTKKTTTKNTTPTGTTKPGTKSKVPAFIVAAGTIGGGAALMTSNKDKKSGSGMTFKEAFAKARKEKGKLATFTYKGKSYSTATADDVKKAGFKSLREYLNANKK